MENYNYLELMTTLKESLETDESMPIRDKEDAIQKLGELFDILQNYFD